MSIALVGNAAEIEPAWAAAGERFDVVTDQTSAHDALVGYVPAEISLDDAARAARAPARRVRSTRSTRVDGRPRPGDARVPAAPARSCSTTATTSGRRRRRPASTNAFDYPGFVPAFIRPQFCEGRGPFRWAALSGDPADILRTDRAILELFPDDAGLAPLDRDGRGAGPVPGPARRGSAGSGYGERAKAGLAFNELVAAGEVSGADRHRPRPPRLRLRRVAQPRDRGDGRRLRRGRRLAAAQRAGQHRRRARPGSRSTTAAASGIGYSQHAGMVVVADGTELAAQKLERVLTTDPGMGVVRHVDAGYERAIEVARERGVRIPMLEAEAAIPSVRPRRRPRRARRRRPRARASSRCAGPTTGSPARTRPARRARRRRSSRGARSARRASPPRIAPSGIVPHTMNRIVAFIRPCIRGVRDRLAERDLVDVPADAAEPADEARDSATAGQISASGAKATGRPDRLNPSAIATSIRPTPTRAVIRLVVSAPTRNPIEPTENANPIASAPRPRSRTRYRMRIALMTLLKKFESRSSPRWSAASGGR